MSTSYFILTKPCKANQTPIIIDNEENVVQYPPKGITYVLPKNLAPCYVNNGLFESHLIEWCKQFLDGKNSVFLDIGAHTGTWSVSLASLSQHVYSFEPQKMTYYALCGSVALSNLRNITCINKGLGSHEQVGIKTLHIVSADGGGSTIQTPHNGSLMQEEINVITLDSLHINNIGFIKMDVEENELAVLQGASETLKRNHLPPIVFECNETNLTINTKHKLYCYLHNDLGYCITSISGVNNMFLAHSS